MVQPQVKEGAAPLFGAAPIPIDIMLPVHGRPELTVKAIKALYANTRAPFHLIILDDTDAAIEQGSFHRVDPTDITSPYLTRLARERPNVTYHNHPHPWIEGNEFFNVGLSYCKHDYVATVMNSVTVQPNWETHALELFEQDPQLGIVGFKNLFPNGTIESAGIVFSNFTPCDFARDAPGHLFTEDIEVPAAQWAFALLRKKAIIGNLEEGLFHGHVGWDDIDNCLAVHAKGWKILYCGHGAGIHEPRATRGTNDVQAGLMNQENAWTFYKRWGFWSKFQEANKLDVKFKLRQETKDKLSTAILEYQVLQVLAQERQKKMAGLVGEALKELGADPAQYYLEMNPSQNLWDMKLIADKDKPVDGGNGNKHLELVASTQPLTNRAERRKVKQR